MALALRSRTFFTSPSRPLGLSASRRLAVLLWTAVLLAPGVASAAEGGPAHQQFVFAYRLLQRGDRDAAADAFEKFVGQFPDHERLGDARYYRSLIAQRGGDLETAAKHLSPPPETSLVPDYAVHLLRGRVTYGRGRAEAALEALERLKPGQLKPRLRATALLLRGLAYRASGNGPAARKALRTAADLDTPLRARALLGLGKAQLAAQQHAEALEALERCLKHASGATAAKAARLAGDAAYALQRYERAASLYERVITRHQTTDVFSEAVIGLMWARLKAQRHERVRAVFEAHAQKLSGRARGEALYLLGAARRAMGDHEQAVGAMARAREAGVPESLRPRLLYKLAASHFARGAYRSMRRALERLRAGHPQSAAAADGAYLAALARVRQGDRAGAAEGLTRIVEQGPSHPHFARALRRRASLYGEKGKHEAAADDLERYLAQREAAAPEAALALARHRHALGQYEAAADAAQRVLAQEDADESLQERALYRLGLTRLRQERPEQALELFGRLTRRFPAGRFRAEARYYTGLLRLTLERAPERAVSDLVAAGRSEAGALSGGLSTGLAANALKLAAVELRARGEKARAAEVFTELGRNFGWQHVTPGQRLWLAERHAEGGRPREAVGHLQAVLAAEPPEKRRARALLLLGKARHRLGAQQKALEALREAVALGFGHGRRARLVLAEVLSALGRHEEAVSAYEELTGSRESRIAAEALYGAAQGYRTRAQRRRRSGDRAGAAEQRALARKRLKRLVLLYGFEALSPLPQRAYVELAGLQAEADEAEEALQTLKDLRESFPDGPWALYARAHRAHLRGRANEARAHLQALRKELGEHDTALSEAVERLRRAVEASE